MLKVQNLSLSFDGKSILNNINFNVEEGDILAIIGVSGSGKTSILKSIAGIHRIPTASIELNGKNITEQPIEKRNTVLVFQDFVLFPHMTVEENMDIASKDKNLHKIVLEKLNVFEHYKKYPNELSGGEQQRVSLSRAIVYKPMLLLLDEPFSNIDALTTKTVRQVVLELLKQFNITTVMVTHDVDDVWTMSDKVLVLEKGIIDGFGIVSDLYENPPTLFTAEKLGDVFEYRNDYYRPEDAIITTDVTKYKFHGIIENIHKFGMYNKLIIDDGQEHINLVDFDKKLKIDDTISFEFKHKLKFK